MSGPSSLDLLWAVRDVRDERLRSTHRHVLVGLVMYRSSAGETSPSVQQLIDSTGLSRATILRSIRDLEEWGMLRVEARGWHRSSSYQFVFSTGKQTSQRETSHTRKASRRETSSDAETSRAETPNSAPTSHTETSLDETSQSKTSQERSHGERTEVSGGRDRGLPVRPSEDLGSEDLSEDPGSRAGAREPGSVRRSVWDGNPGLANFELPEWKARYTDAVRDTLGRDWIFPDKQVSGLRNAVGYCKVPSNVSGWLLREVPRFVRATATKASVYSAFGPDGFVRWLNEGSPEDAAARPAHGATPAGSAVHKPLTPFASAGGKS